MGKYCDEKRGRRRDERGWEERAEEERNCTARVSYRVITILGHFHPLPPLSSSPTFTLPSTPSPSSPRRLLTLNFLSCITALRLSSRVKKKGRNINGRNRRGGENDPASAEKGCFVKFVDLPRRSPSPWPPSVPVASLSCFSFFSFFSFIANAEAWQARDRSQDALRRKRGSETRNTNGNLHS